MKIGNLRIGNDCKPLIIAEMSGNHNQSLKKALEIVKVAFNSGVQAIKLQTFKPETITMKSEKKDFLIKGKANLWSGQNLFNLYKKASTPWEWHEEIFNKAKEYKMLCFSSVFDESSVKFLLKLKTPAFKIASFENNHLPLIDTVAKTKKPIIISTGMATLKEIKDINKILKKNSVNNYAFLKCTSNYPADPKESNILSIPDMKKKFKCEIGISDHTPGIGTSIAAISLGATIIEKHLTLNKNDGAVDSQFSLEPHDFERLVKESEQAWKSLGNINYGPTKSEIQSIKFRRSIYVIKDIKKNDYFSDKNIKIIRPNYGLNPKYYSKALGKKSKKNISAGSPLKKEHIN